jgi:hypothetical protein
MRSLYALSARKTHNYIKSAAAVPTVPPAADPSPLCVVLVAAVVVTVVCSSVYPYLCFKIYWMSARRMIIRVSEYW